MSVDIEQTVARERFAEQLHTAFTIEFDGGSAVAAELVEYSERSVSPRNEQFSLLFRVAADVPVAQAVGHVTHPALGTHALLLVPVGRDDKGLYLEAAFNRGIAASNRGGENP